jgi:hypothetical protein
MALAPNVIRCKSGRSVLRRLRAIYAVPVDIRREAFGRGWAWEIVNGANRIREEFPTLIPDLDALQGKPKTLDDLTPYGTGFGV